MIKAKSITKKLVQNESIILVLIFIIAMGIRLYMASHNRVIGSDGVGYCEQAINFCSGKFVDAITRNQTLYPIIIAFFHSFFRDIEFCGKMVSVISGALLVIVLYLFAKKLYSKKVALMSVLLIAFYPDYVYCSTEVMTESLYIFLRTAAILIGLSALKTNKKISFVVTGIVIGLCYLTRAIGLLDFITMLIFIFLFTIVRPGRMLKKTVLPCLMLSIGFLPLFVSYIIYLHEAQGVWKLSGLGGEQRLVWFDTKEAGDEKFEKDLYSLSPDAREFRESPRKKMGVFILIRNNFKRLPEIYLRALNQMYMVFIPSILSIFIIILSAIGLIQCGMHKTDSFWDLYVLGWIIIPLLALGFVALPLERRFLIPLFPFVLIWASKGIGELSQWAINALHIEKANIKKLFIGIISCIVLVSFVPALKYPMTTGKFWEPYERKLAGLWLKKHTAPDCKIMSRYRIIGFYAERKWVAIPMSDYDKLLKFAQYNDIKYLVFDEVAVEFRPQLAFLIDETKAPEELKPVYIFDDVPAHRFVIYKFPIEITAMK